MQEFLKKMARALKQYASDALPGGSLNPELQPVADRAKYMAGALDQNSQIANDLQDWHKKTQAGLADQRAGRETPEAEYAYQQMMKVGGLAPLGILRNAGLQSSAMKYFGTTNSPSETGYILDNGRRLDFSGRHYATGYEKQGGRFVPSAGGRDYLQGGRNVDHRELGDLVPGQGFAGLSDFINQTGAVRYMPDTGISVVGTNMPNSAQIQKAVEDFRRSRTPMNVDVDALSGSNLASQEFARPTVDSVMEWIKSQMKPEAFK